MNFSVFSLSIFPDHNRSLEKCHQPRWASFGLHSSVYGSLPERQRKLKCFPYFAVTIRLTRESAFAYSSPFPCQSSFHNFGSTCFQQRGDIFTSWQSSRLDANGLCTLGGRKTHRLNVKSLTTTVNYKHTHTCTSIQTLGTSVGKISVGWKFCVDSVSSTC